MKGIRNESERRRERKRVRENKNMKRINEMEDTP